MGIVRNFKTSMRSNLKSNISRPAVVTILLLIIAVSILDTYENTILRSNGAFVLCEYEKTDVRYNMELSGFKIMGSERPTVGGFVVVFFNLKYVGAIQPITLRRVYVVAVKPSGSRVEYEDKSFRGRIMNKGDSISFHLEISPLDEKGTWVFWPAFEYSYVLQDRTYVMKSDDPWHECLVEVYEKTPTTTTPSPQLPDLMFSPRWHTGDRILFYDRCQGFRVHVWNSGNVSTERSTIVEFLVTSLTTGASWRLESVLPQLGPREEVAIYSGIFIGTPNNSYRIRVRIDPGNLITEISELNNERVYTQIYERANLPWVDLEVRNLSLSTDGTLKLRVRRNGCLNSPPTIVHLGVQVGYSQNNWLPTIIELASMRLDRMVGVNEVELSFPNVLNLLRNNAELQAMQAQYVKLNVWIDPVSVELITAEGQSVTVDEFNQNNRAELVLGGKPMILGPRTYFLPRGRETYTIRNPTQIWPAISSTLISGLPIVYSFSVQGCGASVSYNPQNPVELMIRVPGSCTSSITLSITVENIGLRDTLDVPIYFYEISELQLVQNPLIPGSCASLSELGASQAFIFTDILAGVPYSPVELMSRVWWVTGIHPNGTVITEYRNARITVTISWITPSGRRDTYIVPSNDIRIISYGGRTFIVFTVPRNVVFGNIDTKAVSGEIRIEIVTGSNQNVYSRVLPVWIHDSVTYPVYLRSFHFDNTPCPYIDWDMWAEFWGEDAVYDTFGPWKWRDFASDFLYNIFTEMCSHGRCSAYALVSQKFANDDPRAVVHYGNVICRPTPFTLNMSSIVRMSEPPPSESFRSFRTSLNSYITYQYMWSLDERNLRRGADKFARWIRGSDIVLETLNELRQWERLPEDVKWRNVPLLFMFDDVIENSHTVLVYKVEEIAADYVRVWVIDSNRPFQPNSATNQDNSYVEFRCCTSGRRWYFRFYLDDSRTRAIDYFLFATNSSLFYGESAAFTESDAIDMIFELLGLMMTMGATGTSEGSGARASESAPALITIRGDAGIKLREVFDSYGKNVAVFGNSIPPNIGNISGSVLAIPIPAPMANPAYMFISGGMLNMVIEPTKQGLIFVAAGDTNRTLATQYQGQFNEVVNLGIAQDSVRVENSILRDFRVNSLVIDSNLTRHIVLRINTARHTFNISFSPTGSFTIRNRGDNPITIDVELTRYSNIDQQNISYKGVVVSPGDTIIASPRTWDNLSSGELVVKTDIGSDGSIDIESILDTEGNVITKTIAPTATQTGIATTTPIETPTTTTTTVMVTKETSTTLPGWATPQFFITAILALLVLIAIILLVVRRK